MMILFVGHKKIVNSLSPLVLVPVQFFVSYGSLWLEMVGLEVVGVGMVGPCTNKLQFFLKKKMKPRMAKL